MSRRLWMAVLSAGILASVAPAFLAHARDVGCTHTASAIDKTLCVDPGLQALNEATSRLFAFVRDDVTPPVRKTLLAQQRAWLVKRDATCGRGDIDCLEPFYQRHRDWLQALSNRISPGVQLGDLASVALQGRWTVGALLDPGGPGKYPLVDVAKTETLAGLPSQGETVIGKGAQVCYSDGCTPFGFDPHPLKWLPDGVQAAHLLRLKPDTPIFVELLDGKSSFTVISPSDGRLLMDITVCAANSRNCRAAYQVWTAASPDARLAALLP